MKFKKNDTIENVIKKKACCGCGSCFAVCPRSCIEFTFGKRFNYPIINNDECNHCGLCTKVCPSQDLVKNNYIEKPCYEKLSSYITYSSDDAVRLDAASGGFTTGLILHLMKKGFINGGIVAKSQGETPWIAKSIIATSRQELLDSRASKYAPVSNCIALKSVLEKPGKYAFVGTPCMIEGLKKMQKVQPVLKEKIVLTIGFVCAGMASRQSTLAFLQRYNVDLDKAYKISYRGGGWPGGFRVFDKDNNILLECPLLGGSLDLLVPGDHYLRCWNCLDHWAKYADIVVSDPWCDAMVDNETRGWTGIMIRTLAGKEAFESAVVEKDIVAKEVSPDEMYDYNRHLIINDDHSRHSWMAFYRLLMLGKFGEVINIIRLIIKHKGHVAGFKTTLKALFDKNYYENEHVRKKLLSKKPGATENLRLRSEAAHNRQSMVD